MYSPKQIFGGALLGGPAAAVYFLMRNFHALGKAPSARATFWWGVALNVCLVALIPFLPGRFPNYILPLAYSWAVRGIAESKQLSKKAIAASPEFCFESNWKVVGLALAWLVGTGSVWLSLFYVLTLAGAIE